MEKFIARQNIDHYLWLLSNSDLPDGQRNTINRLLVEEEDKLAHSLEQLEFVEQKLTGYRNHMNGLQRWRDGFEDGSSEWVRAGKVLADFGDTLQLLENLSRRIREQLNGRQI